jgi:hypothetical protein
MTTSKPPARCCVRSVQKLRWKADHFGGHSKPADFSYRHPPIKPLRRAGWLVVWNERSQLMDAQFTFAWRWLPSIDFVCITEQCHPFASQDLWLVLGHSAKMSFHSGILCATIFDSGVSLLPMTHHHHWFPRFGVEADECSSAQQRQSRCWPRQYYCCWRFVCPSHQYLRNNHRILTQ